MASTRSATGNAAGSRSEELTDLDCVAFSTGADFSVRMLVADCKSGQKVSPASRAFWLAGARDYVGADRAYLVLQRQVPDAVRELTGKQLAEVDGTIGVITPVPRRDEVAGKVDLGDRARRDRGHCRERVAAVVELVDVQIVHVEQHAAAAAPGELGDEFALRDVACAVLEIARHVLDQHPAPERFLQPRDARAHQRERLLGVRQG